ncbi:hypothetical protein M011DRAFT_486899 [Sporormia fimetaria CBS 119925]|uniref:C2H2-type domain-containing protein n=1 Tax=Sporormia fimetaria CBS 119925 TaxID=1340428 RepID=A0A6A6V8M1_9PLEO|nr:hypothetical protein M011DRAFT_486899 [Sporormia fimetaria CBS 119925]
MTQPKKRKHVFDANTGGSREPFVSMDLTCKHKANGCTFKTKSRDSHRAHEAICRRGDKPGIKCPQCDRDFDDTEQLEKYQKRFHKGFPRACPKCANTMFADFGELEKYRREVHDAIAPWFCNVPGCNSRKKATPFTNKDAVKDHLKRMHGLKKAEDQKKYWPWS